MGEFVSLILIEEVTLLFIIRIVSKCPKLGRRSYKRAAHSVFLVLLALQLRTQIIQVGYCYFCTYRRKFCKTRFSPNKMNIIYQVSKRYKVNLPFFMFKSMLSQLRMSQFIKIPKHKFWLEILLSDLLIFTIFEIEPLSDSECITNGLFIHFVFWYTLNKGYTMLTSDQLLTE